MRNKINGLFDTVEENMTLVVHCRDVGFDCDGVVKADNEQDLLKQVAEHAQSAHGLEEVTDEIVEKVKSVIREE
jgi:predicted small metal-binding protein